MRKYIFIAMLSLALAACNQDKTSWSLTTPSRLDGTYTTVDGKKSYIFSLDGKVRTKSLGGEELVTSYIREGGKVNFKFPQGYPISMSLNSDGSLTSDSNINYKKAN